MASISSLSGSSSSSVYGTRNVLSGLASGLDTETLIENAISGYKLKLTNLQQDRTKVEWQQEAYRSMIDKMVNFSQKYTSYTSGTNLLSSNFFDSAMKISSLGENASRVSATGKTNSTVQINSVSQLATAARYSVGAENMKASNEAGTAFSLSDEPSVGTLKGSLTLGYGGKTVRLSFDESDIFNSGDGVTGAEKMAAAINKKLEEQNISFDGGTQAKASERIQAVADGNTIRLETVKSGDGNGVWVDATSGNVASKLGISIADNDDTSVTSFAFNEGNVTGKKNMVSLIEEKGFTITLDGVSKTIKGPSLEELGAGWESIADPQEKENAYLEALQTKINEAFGAGKLTVKDADDGAEGIRLRFDARKEESAFQVTSTADEALGMAGGLTSYVNTERTLSDMLAADDAAWNSWRVEAVGKEANFKPSEDGTYHTDEDGNRVKKDETNGKWYQVNSNGEDLYAFKINGDTSITVSKDTTLEELMKAVNNSEDVGVTMAYSEFTGKFTFTAKETGAGNSISFGEDGLSAALFAGENTVSERQKAKELLGYDKLTGEKFSITLEDGQEVSFTFAGESGTMNDVLGRINGELGKLGSGLTASYSKTDGSLLVKDGEGKTYGVTYNEGVARDLFNKIGEKNGYTAGQDAKFNVTVNGETRELTRSSNTIAIDGMSVTLKGTFEADTEAVTFSMEADADKIVNVVKSMIEDYNAMAKEIKDAYSTLPLENSSGDPYEPLTDEDRADMSESAVEAYEKKAKTGLLFGDRDLSNLYTGLTNALSVLGVSGNDAQKLGIATSYSNGLTTLTLDESTLRASLAEDPEGVKEVFTRSTKNGDSSDGLMQGLKNQLDKYANTTGAVKGILIEKAGSTLAPTSVYQNTLQTKLDSFDTQIKKWQDMISDKIDYYNTKFTALEQLVAQMNNQSSMLAGLSGGY